LKQVTTRIKQAVLEGAAAAEAIKLGAAKAEQKLKSHKPLVDSLREYFEDFIRKVDPLELIAVVAGTFVIYDIVNRTQKVIDSLAKLAQAGSKGTGGLSADFFNFLGLMFGQVNILKLKEGQTYDFSLNKDQGVTFGVCFLASWLIFKRGGLVETSAIPTVTGILAAIGL